MTDLKQKEILKLLKEYKLRCAKEGLYLAELFGLYAMGNYDV